MRTKRKSSYCPRLITKLIFRENVAAAKLITALKSSGIFDQTSMRNGLPTAGIVLSTNSPNRWGLHSCQLCIAVSRPVINVECTESSSKWIFEFSLAWWSLIKTSCSHGDLSRGPTGTHFAVCYPPIGNQPVPVDTAHGRPIGMWNAQNPALLARTVVLAGD